MKIKITIRLEKMLLLQRWFLAKEGWPRHGTLLGFSPTNSSHRGSQQEDGKVPVSARSQPSCRGELCRHPHTHSRAAVFNTGLWGV